LTFRRKIEPIRAPTAQEKQGKILEIFPFQEHREFQNLEKYKENM
jgi:hypothetical protein